MTEGIVDRLSKLKVWSRGDERAPHKPLLLLSMIGRYLRGEPRLVSFREIEQPLRQLLIDFGPSRKSYHPELPFWHLHSDGFWELQNMAIPPRGVGSTSAKKKLLIDNNALGGLSQEYYESLKDPRTASEAITELLDRAFPESIHEDILEAVGIELTALAKPGPRDPAFRDRILQAYEYKCAICGFWARSGNALIGVEAAHIKWHQAGGPDTHPNGVALCSLHHKLFDRGLIGFTEDRRIMVSETASGSAMFEHLVLDFHGGQLSPPVRKSYWPNQEFVAWHVREVFHPPARESLSH